MGRTLLAALLLIATCLTSGSRASPGTQKGEGASIPIMEVVGTTLRMRLADGSILEGTGLVGAKLVLAFGGDTFRVRIAGVERDTTDVRGEVLLYDFRVMRNDGSEEPLCSPDADGRRLGFPIAGRIDKAGILQPGQPHEIELVCLAGAQGKCIRMGYAPWRKAPDGRSMLDWHRACVRLMRADYCGDGTAFTRNGTLVDIYDRIGVQNSDEDRSLSFEAAWGPEGAVCVAHTRISKIIDLDGLARACPRLASRLGPGICHDQPSVGLIVNRSRP